VRLVKNVHSPFSSTRRRNNPSFEAGGRIVLGSFFAPTDGKPSFKEAPICSFLTCFLGDILLFLVVFFFKSLPLLRYSSCQQKGGSALGFRVCFCFFGFFAFCLVFAFLLFFSFFFFWEDGSCEYAGNTSAKPIPKRNKKQFGLNWADVDHFEGCRVDLVLKSQFVLASV